jgi:hypothetical protein
MKNSVYFQGMRQQKHEIGVRQSGRRVESAQNIAIFHNLVKQKSFAQDLNDW